VKETRHGPAKRIEGGIMGAQVLKSDESDKREPRNQDPSRNPSLKEALQGSSPPPSGRQTVIGAADALEPPWQPAAKPKTRHGTFEGDEAAIELRSRLAAARNGTLAPRESIAPSFSAVMRFTGLILTAAVAAGAVGYVVGVRLPFKPPVRFAATSSGEAQTGAPADAVPTPAPTLAAHHPGQRGGLPVINGATGAGRAADGGASSEADAAQRREAAPAPAVLPLPPPDAEEIAARLKLGADLMAAGDIAAARTMFARAAEAGDPAGAFALAETYDPAVLGAMRLRGSIAPDPGRARQWYEKARDMGSSAAPDRIARLAGR
jgi:hypothetical protein